MKFFNQKTIFILALFGIAVVISNNLLQHKGVFATAEEGLYFTNLDKAADMSGFVWQQDGFGYPVSVVLPQYPLLLVLSKLNVVFSTIQLQHYFYTLLIFLGLLGMWLFTSLIFKSKTQRFLCSIFYLLNLFVISQILSRYLVINIVTWAYLPMFSYLSIYTLHEGFRKKIVAIYILTVIFFSFSYGLPTNLIMIWIPSMMYFISQLFMSREHSLIQLRRIIILIILWMSISLWWIIPYFYLAGSSFAFYSASESFNSLKEVSSFFPVNDILQLKQKYFFDINENPLINWSNYYDSTVVRISTNLIAIIMLLGLFSKKVNKKIFLYTSFIVVFALIAVSSTDVGYLVYGFIFEKFPFLQAFRNPYEKLGLVYVLFYSVFFTYGLVNIFSNRSIRSGLIKTVFFALLIYITTKPLSWGVVYPMDRFVDIPNQYNQVNGFLNSRKDIAGSRVLLLPMLESHVVAMDWGYNGDEGSRYWLDKRAISRNTLYTYNYTAYKDIATKINNNSFSIDDVNKYGIEYIIFDKSIINGADNKISPDDYLALLSKEDLIEDQKDFESLIVYKAKLKEGMIVADSDDIKLTYHENDAQNYVVDIRNQFEDKFLLVFKESFNPNWKAYIDGKEIVGHKVWNEYANSWIVDKKGDYTIDIRFKVWPWE